MASERTWVVQGSNCMFNDFETVHQKLCVHPFQTQRVIALHCCTGYILGVLNTSLKWMAEDLNFDETKGGSLVVSAALLGAIIGSLAAGQIADAFGPKKALAANNVPLLFGYVLCAWAPGGFWTVVAGDLSQIDKSESCSSALTNCMSLQLLSSLLALHGQFIHARRFDSYAWRW